MTNKIKILIITIVTIFVVGLCSCARNNIASGEQACTITLRDARGVTLQTWEGDIVVQSNAGDASTTFKLDGQTITIRGGIVTIVR